MIKVKSWFYLLFVLFFGFASLLISVNFLIDPYGLNNLFQLEGINKNKTQTDGQSRRFKFSLMQNKDFDGVFLGSSEMTFIGNTDMAKKISDYDFFNMAVNEQEIFETHAYLERIATTRDVKIAIISLNPLKFSKDSPNYRHIEPTELFQTNNFFLYFSISSLVDSLKTLYKNLANFEQIYNESGTKIVDRAKYYNIPENEVISWTRKNVESSPNYFYEISKNFQVDQAKLNILKKIVSLCGKKNIQLKLFIPPLYQKHLHRLNIDNKNKLASLKLMISEIHPVYDFMIDHELNSDFMNFIDQVSHPSKKLSLRLLNDIFTEDGDLKYGKLISKQ